MGRLAVGLRVRCYSSLTRETMTALDELTRVLALGPVYEFQR